MYNYFGGAIRLKSLASYVVLDSTDFNIKAVLRK